MRIALLCFVLADLPRIDREISSGRSADMRVHRGKASEEQQALRKLFDEEREEFGLLLCFSSKARARVKAAIVVER